MFESGGGGGGDLYFYLVRVYVYPTTGGQSRVDSMSSYINCSDVAEDQHESARAAFHHPTAVPTAERTACLSLAIAYLPTYLAAHAPTAASTTHCR